MFKLIKEDGNGYQDLTTYTESTFEVSFAINSTDSTKLQPGKNYRFRSYSLNSLSIPSYSYEIRIAAAQLPSQPTTGPTWIQSLSNTTSIGVSWQR